VLWVSSSRAHRNESSPLKGRSCRSTNGGANASAASLLRLAILRTTLTTNTAERDQHDNYNSHYYHGPNQETGRVGESVNLWYVSGEATGCVTECATFMSVTAAETESATLPVTI